MPRIQVPLLLAIFLTVLATLTLGIFPSGVLRAARAAAVTLQYDQPAGPASLVPATAAAQQPQ